LKVFEVGIVEVWKLVKKTLKRFVSLAKTTPDSVVSALCGYDLDVRSREVVERERMRWEARKIGRKIEENGSNEDNGNYGNPEPDQFGEGSELSEEAKEELRKWNKRLDQQMDSKCIINFCRGMPASVIEFSNLLTKICPRCKDIVKTRMSPKHLESVHMIRVPEVVQLCKTLTKDFNEMEETRILKMFYAHEKVKSYVMTVKEFIENTS